MSRSSVRIAPLAAIFAINGAVYGSLLPRYPQLADQVGASTGKFGIALAGIGFGGIAGAFVATRAIRLLGGPVPALLVTGSVFLAAAVAVAAAPSLGLLTLAFTALGLFDGFVDTAMNQAGTAIRARHGVSVMGRLHAALAAATVAATAVGATVAGVVPLPLHILVVSALLFIVLLIALRVLRSEIPGSPAAGVTSGTDNGHMSAGVRRRRQPLWWAVLIGAGLVAVLVELPAQEWSALLLSRELSAGPLVSGLGPLVAVSGVLIGRLGLDRAVNSFGWRIIARVAGAATSVGLLVGLSVSAATDTALPLLVGLGISAVGAGVAVPLLFDRSNHLAVRVGLPPESGPGLVSGTFRIGVLISPLLIGGVAEIGGLYLALAVAAVAGAALIVLAKPLTD